MLEVDDKFKVVFNRLNEYSASYNSVNNIENEADEDTEEIERNICTLLHSVMDLIFVARDIAEEQNAEDDLYELRAYSGQICMFICSVNELAEDSFIMLCFYKAISVTLCNVMLHITNILRKNDYNTEIIINGFRSFSGYMDNWLVDRVSEITSGGNNIYDYLSKIQETLQSLNELILLQIKISNKSYGMINSYLLFSCLLEIESEYAEEQLCKSKGTIDDDLGILLIFSEERGDFDKKPDYKIIYTLVNDLFINCKDKELKNCLHTLRHSINCLMNM